MYEKTIEPVAIMHTGFGEKFGIPRQSGLVPEAAGQIVFEPKYQNPDSLRGIESLRICGLYGAFPKTKWRNSHRSSHHPGLEAGKREVFLPHVRRFAQTAWDYPL